MTGGPWMTAREAAARLGVSRATLYAYVSRGHVRSQATAGTSRARAYAREDVERLRQRRESRRDPERAAADALRWGVPVLESAITLIDGRGLYYRGRNAVTLARTASVDAVARLIWNATAREPRGDDRGRNRNRDRNRDRDRHGRLATGSWKLEAGFVGRAQEALARAAAGDPAAFDVRPERVAAAGGRILDTVVSTATGTTPAGEAADVALACAWRVDRRATDVIRAALILCADHELNVSSFTARCIASAGSSPYAVVIGGLAALEGPRHGGAGARVETMLDSMRRSRDLPGAVAARLQRGEPIDGFGHPLYPDGDPRAAALLDLLRASYARSAELTFVLGVARAASDAGHGHPNLDFALASASRVLCLPAGAPLVLFAIGRTIGWIGHAIEQYASGQLIRPRARYTGVQPAVD
jgi:citrate synthase